MTTADVPERAAVIMAHPDDSDFSAAGTIAAWCDAGAEVSLVVVTDGSKGTSDRAALAHELVATRMAEQRAAARVLGVAEVFFLGYVDGEVVPDLALRRRITRQLRLLRPDTVITHDPARLYFDGYINHPDHRAVGQATLDAIYPTARDHLNYAFDLAEGLEPHAVTTVLLTGALNPDAWVDIEDTFERKIAALREHGSQIKDIDKLRERLEGWARDVGKEADLAYAEAFKKISFA